MITTFLDRAIEILVFIGAIAYLINMYLQWQTHGPLTGTPKQRIKCVLGYHDFRLFAFTTDPAWRVIWRCHRCAYECLTPDTHAKRAVIDAALPAIPDAAIGKTVKL